ncbi:fanconi anemia group J protein [Trifolium pratense]|uniref:Fanconi anemia group J protein n=1 Tax=Trifolium pratense TaxID=57577 RepID=A0A2K3P626_TRIPR|nr:fanconi anemia group J protein [Trifolium pratense]
MNGLEEVRAVIRLHSIGNFGSMIKLAPRVEEHNNLPKEGEDGSCDSVYIYRDPMPSLSYHLRGVTIDSIVEEEFYVGGGGHDNICSVEGISVGITPAGNTVPFEIETDALGVGFGAGLMFPGESSVPFTHDETSIVKESPCLDIGSDAGSSDYSKNDNSDSTIIEASARFAMDRLSSFPVSSTTGSKVSMTVTPEKSVTANNIPETESSLNLSVNSHNQKRRKSMVIPFVNLIEEENNDASCASTPTWCTKSSLEVREATHRTECSYGKILNSQSPQLPTNNIPGSCSVPLLDKSRIPKSTQEQGIWCPEDGCVFSTIFCPFCSNTNNLLGVQIMATNSSNVQLLDKYLLTSSPQILFFVDSLEMKNQEETGKSASEEMGFLPIIDSGMGGVAALNSLEKYSYVPQPGKSEVRRFVFLNDAAKTKRLTRLELWQQQRDGVVFFERRSGMRFYYCKEVEEDLARIKGGILLSYVAHALDLASVCASVDPTVFWCYL